jgi:hypothetical protein
VEVLQQSDYFLRMEKKIDVLRDLIANDKRHDAIKFAAKFPRLDHARDAILRAKDAIGNPSFYRQIGRDPESLIAIGWDAVCKKYSSVE